MRLPRPRPVVAVVTVALAAVGLVGAYHYWESYYQHRGFVPVAFLPHAHRGHLQRVGFYSPALHRVTDYLVYTPPGYDQGLTRYPVYYLLHGSPGRPVVWLSIASLPVRMDNLISQHRMRPMILVFPDGRIGGRTFSDSEWANTPSGQYASYVSNVVHDVDGRFRTLAKRGARVIAGFSAGAYGATNILLHAPGDVRQPPVLERLLHRVAQWRVRSRRPVRAPGQQPAGLRGAAASHHLPQPRASLPVRRTRRQRQSADGRHGPGAGRRRRRRHLGAVPRRP